MDRTTTITVAAPAPAATPATTYGPAPTADEIHAAAERLALRVDLDLAAVQTIAARLGQLAAAEPRHARPIASALALAVDALRRWHTDCSTVGCTRCLYLADAAAVVAGWRKAGGR